MAIRGYFSSPRHLDDYIESHLDIRDKDGSVVPGYGWIFPLGDGRVNVGIGLLSTFDRWKQVNTSKLMSSFVDFAPASWCLNESTALSVPTGGRLPMGLSVGPHVGPDYLLVGDAGGAINPFNGEGIAYGYETGRLAARIVAEAIQTKDIDHLVEFDRELDSTYGLYYKVASKFMTVMGNPVLMRRLVSTGMHSQSVMQWLLRIMSNLLRPDERGPAELAYRALVRIANSSTAAS
jgi:flavin-dependent dehydrogenase